MAEPIGTRPHMPGYGTLDAEHGTGLLPWSWARERLDRATYALEGNIYATGAAVAWAAQLLGLHDAGDVERLHLWAGTGYRHATAEPAGRILARLASGL